MAEFETTNICFWYIPKRLRGLEETPDWWNELATVGESNQSVADLRGAQGAGAQDCKF